MTSVIEELAGMREAIALEWQDNIAPFWLKYGPDDDAGGFRGYLSNDLSPDPRADKGIILNSRILWTFSAAYRLYGDPAFLRAADRAYGYVAEHFIDHQYGGVFWTVNYQGRPGDTRKKTYAQAFAVYGLTEYYLAAGAEQALHSALGVFDLMESRCRDPQHEGYFETFDRDWSLAAVQRLSEVDQDEKKSMNTHLHVLEAYARLLDASGAEHVKVRLRAVLNIFLKRILHRRLPYLEMFFDEEWSPKSEVRSFGHDIEASWLLVEAAEALEDEALGKEVRSVALRMAQSVQASAIAPDGSLLYEADGTGIINRDRDWWVQAEAVVGFLNAYQLGGGSHFASAALGVWRYIDRNVIDKRRGEWFWKITPDGIPSVDYPKMSQWKCPYHNGRMCFEVARRLRAG